ncbi:hypothetical protein HD806DRAFT_528463 [Xylariaceae sp. AK1471]|nr:hypothetical protein HD806DRAFT_528463 [Xylariaceae sp. AK1471]
MDVENPVYMMTNTSLWTRDMEGTPLSALECAKHDTPDSTLKACDLDLGSRLYEMLDAGKPFYPADLSYVVRSKKSGPYEIIFDAMFATEDDEEYVKIFDLYILDFLQKSWKADDKDVLVLIWLRPTAVSIEVYH